MCYSAFFCHSENRLKCLLQTLSCLINNLEYTPFKCNIHCAGSLELGAMPSLFRPVARNQEFKLSLCVCSRRLHNKPLLLLLHLTTTVDPGSDKDFYKGCPAGALYTLVLNLCSTDFALLRVLFIQYDFRG